MSGRPPLALLLMWACGPGAEGLGPKRSQTDRAHRSAEAGLEGAALAARLSVDLRGVRPSVDELEQVQADPGALDMLVETWLEDPRFSQRMASLWNDHAQTAVWPHPDQYDRLGELDFPTWQALGDEPLQLAAAVIEADLPWSTVVTSQQTVVNPALAALYGVDAPGADWSWVDHPDGRPGAGVLSTNAFWLRHVADATNFNRGRANTVARVFLCADFFERESSPDFAISAASLAEVETAVSTEPACLTCHAALDPLASVLGGHAQRSDRLPIEQYFRYSPLTARYARARLAPAYFGVPVTDEADVGVLIAGDPRFVRCAAEQFHTALVGAPPASAAVVDGLAQVLVDDGERIRALVRAIVQSAAYREGARRVLRPEQLHDVLVDLLAWNPDPTDPDAGLMPLRWGLSHRAMAGGGDDVAVVLRAPATGLGMQAVGAWAARRAVAPALSQELARPQDSRAFLTLADGRTDDRDTVRAQLAALHTRFLSAPVAADDPALDDWLSLWDTGGGDAAPESAWALVLEALVRHPAQVTH